MNFLDYFASLQGQYVKKISFEILQERYAQNEPILERLSHNMTESDTKAFVKLLTDVYEIAYLKAVNDHKEQLTKIGLTAKIV